MKKVTDYCDLNIDGLTLRQAIDMLEHVAEDFGDDRLIEVDGDYAGGWVRFEFKRPETPEERVIRLQKERDAHAEKKRRDKEREWRKIAEEMTKRDQKIINEHLAEWERWRVPHVD